MARPVHSPTVASRRRVAVAAGGGIPHHAIASMLGITKPTLERRYPTELASGAAARRIEVLEQLFRSAKLGRVTAMRGYLRRPPVGPRE